MKRELSQTTFKKYISWLRSGQAMNANDLKALTSAINNKASDAQLLELLNLAENCKLPVPNGLLVGFEAKNCLISGTRFWPIVQKIVNVTDNEQSVGS